MWIVREINLHDSEKLFVWRNNPEIYKYFFSAQPVAKNAHEAWLKRIVVNTAVTFYIVSFENEELGTVRFDLNEDKSVAEVGIYLDPKFHGKNLGVKMLEVCQLKFKESFPTLKKIIAKVLPENVASEKMFLRNGYEKKLIQLEKTY